MMSQQRICAIHQPNFFPWLGYFDKIKHADVFIFLDKVDFPKTSSGTWCNRVKIAIQNEAKWIGCPIKRYSGNKSIVEIQIHDEEPWRKKLLRTLSFNYVRTKNYKNIIEFIESLIMYETDSLADFNINAIKKIASILKLPCEFRRQSEFDIKDHATELLINLTKASGCDTYLCGGGAGGYQLDHLFQENHINLQYQNFEVFPYEDQTFIPGLSVIDFLMKAEEYSI